jgi:hypothetical protein
VYVYLVQVRNRVRVGMLLGAVTFPGLQVVVKHAFQ